MQDFENKMLTLLDLEDGVPLEKASVDISEGIAAMVGALQDNNPTFAALRESFPNSPSWTCTGWSRFPPHGNGAGLPLRERDRM